MAYAYPSGGDHSASSSSLAVHQPPVRTHSSGNSRKGSEEKFDILKEIKAKIEEDDNYLQFFQERIKLEEEYIQGLRRLYSRSKAIDTLHDDAFRREEKTTVRRAWDEVREYSTREIQAKEALVSVLRDVIVYDLVKLKEEQARIRQGLKENMKHANEMYDEHAKNQLPRLKRAYFHKTQALEDHRRQEHAIAMQAKLLADSPTSSASTPLREHPNAFVASNNTSYPLSPPSSTPAIPASSNPALAHPSVQFDMRDTKEEKKAHGRLRASSAGGQAQAQAKEVLNDIAAQSKKGFNAIISKLGGDKSEKEDGGIGPIIKEDEGLHRRNTSSRGDPTRGMGTMRGVKVKREADEADKAYRLGVFHLESLRLRRDKLQTSAARNLEAFSDELNKKVAKCLELYMDTLHATAATNAQATGVVREAIEAVNLDKDMSLFRARLKAVDTQRTQPVPYHNYYVGECRSLIFGVSLTDYDFARGEGSDHGRPPTIVEKCIAAIDERGLRSEGIYRISGRHAGVQKLIQSIELDEEKFQFDGKDDVFSISNVLKQYLRELPEPVFHFPQVERVKYTENRETHIHSNFSALRGRLRRLAPIHQTTFQAIVEHLSRVAANSSVNKMDGKNLAVVFNSVIFGQDQIGSEASLLNMGQEKDTLLEDIITYSDLLFGADENPAGPGIFPPGSGLSRNGVISYHPVEDGPQPGSARTKFRIIDPGEADVAPAALEPPAEIAAPPMPQAAHPDLDDYPIMNRFTPDEALELLFDSEVIPQSLRDQLGPDLHARPLASTDFLRSHFGLLANLTESPAMAPSIYSALFAHLKSCPDTYFYVVVIDKKTDQMVAHGAVFVENKFIHGGSSAGHIEEIVVSPDLRGGGVGKTLVIGLRDLALARGCYRVELHCGDKNVPFYEKCGFVRKSVGMTYYRPKDDQAQITSSAAKDVTHAFAKMLPLDTGAPLVIDLTKSDMGDYEVGFHGSPRTVNSNNSSGIIYSYPTLAAPSGPLLPPRPAAGTPVPPVEQATVPPPLPPRNGEPTVVEQNPETTPTPLEQGQDAPDTPAWAEEGLGSSERAIDTSRKGSLEPVTEQVRSTTPLPPGAAPANLEQEPERIVEPKA